MDPIAHASVALMAKPAVPRVRLWVLLAAAQVPGLLFFAFEAAGMEHKPSPTWTLGRTSRI